MSKTGHRKGERMNMAKQKLTDEQKRLDTDLWIIILVNGDVVLYPCYNTLQVSDYSKFNMSSFDENVKKKTHDELFPMDLQNAYNLGYQLSR